MTENNPFIEIAKENFLAGLELLKEYDTGTPEFELGFQLITAYKIYRDRLARRIIERPRVLGGEND